MGVMAKNKTIQFQLTPEKRKKFQLKFMSEDMNQREAMTILLDKYLDGEIEITEEDKKKVRKEWEEYNNF
jgi:hypothetical protein